jgi:ribosomal protein L32
MSLPHRVCKACGHTAGKEIVKKGDTETQAG